MDRLKICAVSLVALAAILSSSPKSYNSLRAYYYRIAGGALLVPDRPAPPRHAPPAKVAVVQKKPAVKTANAFAISGLDPTVGPQVIVIGAAASNATMTASQTPMPAPPETAAPAGNVSEGAPQDGTVTEPAQ